MAEIDQVEKLEGLLGKLEYEKDILRQRLEEEMKMKQKLVLQHRSKFNEINEKLKLLVKDSSNMKERFKVIQSERDRYKKILSALPTVHEYRDQCKQLRECSADNQLLESKVKELENNLTNVKHQLIAKENCCASLRIDLGEMRCKYEEVRGKLKVECEAKPHSITKLHAQLHYLQQENNTLKTMLSKKHSELEVRLNKEKREEEGLQTQVSQREQQVIDLSEKIQALQTRLSEADQEICQLQTHNDGLERKVAQLEDAAGSYKVNSDKAVKLDRLIGQCYSKLLSVTKTLEALVNNSEPDFTALLGLNGNTGEIGEGDCRKIEFYEDMLHKLDSLRVKLQRVYVDRCANPDTCRTH